MQISLENDSNIGLNKNDAQNIENNSNADHLINDLARKPQDDLQNYAQNIENNPNADNLVCQELARKPQDDLCSVEVLNDEGNNGKRKRNKRPAYLHTPQGDSTHAPAHDFSYFFIKKHIFKLRTIYYTLFTFVFTFEVL